MDRIALAKRLESLSSVFASHTPYNRDLRAMSYVLSKLSDDKFKTIVSSNFDADVAEACMCGKGPGALPAVIPMGDDVPMGGAPVVDVPVPEGVNKVIVIKGDEGPMSAEATEKTAGMFWCKEASQAVVDNLLKDVVAMNKTVCCDTGRKLETEQIPDGTHKGIPEKPVTLKPEQTPDVSESIETGMVQKSHGAVQKEAGSIEGPGKPDGTGPMKDSPECSKNKEDASKDASLADIKKKKEEAEKAKLEKDVKDLKKAKKEKKASDEEDDKDAEKDDKDAAESSSSFEGIELTASMDEVELGVDEAAQLSKLFE